ncbi:MAG: hypothetical protein IJO85_07415 [Lachnospiraceae bacterium]|nr:hypothetical protein [Lachnospiraceae bacterium]
MDKQKLIDITHEITDDLEKEANAKLAEAKIYHEGYIQACEDYGKRIRQAVYKSE